MIPKRSIGVEAGNTGMAAENTFQAFVRNLDFHLIVRWSFESFM